MQFWQPSRERVAKSHFFCSHFEKDKQSIVIIKKNIFPQKFLLDT